MSFNIQTSSPSGSEYAVENIIIVHPGTIKISEKWSKIYLERVKCPFVGEDGTRILFVNFGECILKLSQKENKYLVSLIYVENLEHLSSYLQNIGEMVKKINTTYRKTKIFLECDEIGLAKIYLEKWALWRYSKQNPLGIITEYPKYYLKHEKIISDTISEVLSIPVEKKELEKTSIPENSSVSFQHFSPVVKSAYEKHLELESFYSQYLK